MGILIQLIRACIDLLGKHLDSASAHAMPKHVEQHMAAKQHRKCARATYAPLRELIRCPHTQLLQLFVPHRRQSALAQHREMAALLQTRMPFLQW